VQKAYAAAGVSLPRVVGPQMSAGRKISAGELAPGDLVAYPSMSHIGIYLGDGKVIHAPRPGKSVEITSLSSGFGVYARVS
jgi:cell wall-associated NlpC family hydrolase